MLSVKDFLGNPIILLLCSLILAIIILFLIEMIRYVVLVGAWIIFYFPIIILIISAMFSNRETRKRIFL